MHNPTWSSSSRFDRGDNVPVALARYNSARETALADPTDGNLDAWGAAVDRLIATRATTPADAASKVRAMLIEGRGGDSCLIAILEDLDGMIGRNPADGGASALAHAGKAVGHA